MGELSGVGSGRSYNTYHEILGAWHIPNVRVLRRAADGDWLLETNSIGIRDPREFSRQVPPGTTRILLFGDSFTLGQGVPVEDRYSAVMESRVDGLEIINFGHAGSGTDVQYLAFDHFAGDFAADLVMINPHVSNITRNTSAHHVRLDGDGRQVIVAKPFFELVDGDLVLRNVPVPEERIPEDDPRFGGVASDLVHDQSDQAGRVVESRLHRVRHSIVNRSAIKYRAVRHIPIQPFPQYDSPDDPAWRLMRAILERWTEEAAGRPVVIAPLPGWYHVVNPKLANHRPRFAELHDPDRDVHVVDVLPRFWALDFADRRACFLSPADGHYSPIGHRVVAEALIAALDDSGLLTRHAEGRRRAG